MTAPAPLGRVVYGRDSDVEAVRRWVKASTCEPQWYSPDSDRWCTTDDLIVDHARMSPAAYTFGGLAILFLSATGIGYAAAMGADTGTWAAAIGLSIAATLSIVWASEI